MSGRARRSELGVALFVTVLWAALVFAIDGVLAIVLDRDPVVAPVGPYYAIVSLLLAAVVTWLCVAAALHGGSPWPPALAATALVYLVLVVSAIPVALELVVDQALSPFVFTAALLAGLVVLLAGTVLRRWWPGDQGSRGQSPG